MSAGAFESGKYQDNDGNIYKCRPQPETKALVINAITNAYPAGAVDAPVSARLTGGKRKIGCVARTVTLRWTGAVPEGYEDGGTVTVPVFTAAAYNGYGPGRTGTYLASSVEVVGRSPERIR